MSKKFAFLQAAVLALVCLGSVAPLAARPKDDPKKTKKADTTNCRPKYDPIPVDVVRLPELKEDTVKLQIKVKGNSNVPAQPANPCAQ